MEDLLDDKTKAKWVKKFKVIRAEKKLTQEGVAKKAGLHTNTYAKIEREVENPTTDTLLKIAKALGIKSSKILPF